MSIPSISPLIEPTVTRFIQAEDYATAELSKKLKLIIDDQFQQSQSQQQLAAILARFTASGIDLLNYESRENNSRLKIAGLIIVDSLLDLNDEGTTERRIEILNNLRKIFENDNKLPIETNKTILRLAALSIGHFARIASVHEIEFLQTIYLASAFKLIANPKSPQHRLAGALILTQLTLNSPALIFSKRKEMFAKIWDCVSDKSSIVREAAAEALEAGLQLVSQREEMSDYLKQALRIVDEGFTVSASERVTGSLLIFDIIVGGEVVSLDKLRNSIQENGHDFVDVIWKVLVRRESTDMDIKTKVIDLIPKLSNAFSATFNQTNRYTQNKTLLLFSVEYLLGVIRSKRDRAIAYKSLGELFLKSPALRSLDLTTIMAAVSDGFKDPFCTHALHCLSNIVQAAPSSRQYVDKALIQAMFREGLTADLSEGLKIIIKYVPSMTTHIQSQLRLHIHSVLQRYEVMIDDAIVIQPIAAPTPTGKGAPLKRFARVLASATGGGSGAGGSSGGAAAVTPKSGMGLWGQSFFSSVAGEVSAAAPTMSAEAHLTLAFQILASPEFFPKRIIRSRSHSSSESLQLLPSLSAQAPGEAGEEDLFSSLLWVLSNAVVRYLDDINPEIRGAAARTCLAVLDSLAFETETDSSEFTVISRIIDRIFVIGVGDDSGEIRLKIFSAISPSLDHIVSQSQNLHCLVEALDDEFVEVRVAAMLVLARSAHFDSLRILPTLLVTMERLIKQLQFSKDHHLRHESVQLLHAIARGATTLLIPYTDQILVPLLALLNDPSVAVVGAVLATISELAVAAPESVVEYLEKLFPCLIEALNDVSSVATQEIAVVAMGKLVSSLALLTEEPYGKFPELFGGLVRAIQNEDVSSKELRLQAIRTVGLLGAVDPVLYGRHLQAYGEANAFSSQHEVSEDEDVLGVGGDTVPALTTLKDDEKRLSKTDRYYISVVLRALTAILRDSSLAMYHLQALNIAIRVVKHVGPQAFPYINDFVNGMVFRMYATESSHNMREALLDHLSSLLHIIGRNMRKYQNVMVKLITDFFESNLQGCLGVLESMYVVFSVPTFGVILRSVLPIMLHVIRDEPLGESFASKGVVVDTLRSTSESSLMRSTRAASPLTAADASSKSVKKSQLPKTMRILQSFANMKENLGAFRRELVHVIIHIFDNTAVVTESRLFALQVFMHLVDDNDLLEIVNRVIHPLMRMVTAVPPEPALQSMSLIALSLIVCRLGVNYIPYVIPVRRCIRSIPQRADASKSTELEEYESLVSKLLKQRTLPKVPKDAGRLAVPKTLSVFDGRTGKDGPFQMGLQALETAWALANRNNASDFSDWMQRLSMELIRQSPSTIIRMCAPLTKVYRPLAEQLFNASFSSIWEELYAGESTDVIDDIPLVNGIEMALCSSQLPSDIASALLNLSEFMDMNDKRLPVDVQILAKQAERANMFAKCLRYREIEFNSSNMPPSSECVEALITVNNELGLVERASGVLNFVTSRYPDMMIKPLWLEKLNYWEEARISYLAQSKLMKLASPRNLPPSNPDWMASELGVLRCLYALGDFDELAVGAGTLKNTVKSVETDPAIRSWCAEVQNLGANAAWMLGKWDLVGSFVGGDNVVDTHDVELTNNTTFFKAVLAIHKHSYDEALTLVAETRSNLSQAISTLLSENYSRAYRAMVSMQMLAELEEVVEYKQAVSRAAMDLETARSGLADSHDEVLGGIGGQRKSFSGLHFDEMGILRDGAKSTTTTRGVDLAAARASLIRKWRGRLKLMPKEIDIYRQVLAVHTLVVDPIEDLESWLELTTLCRKESMYSLCGNLLKRLGAPINVEPVSADYLTPNTSPMPKSLMPVLTPVATAQKPHKRVLFATYKYLWACGEKQRALDDLSQFLMSPDIAIVKDSPLEAAGRPSDPRADRRSSFFDGAMMAGADSTAISVSVDLRMKLFRVKCLLKRAEWMRELGERFQDVLSVVREARDLAEDDYSVWHAWAVTNYDQLRKVDGQESKLDSTPTRERGLTKVPSSSSLFEIMQQQQQQRQGSPDHANGTTGPRKSAPTPIKGLAPVATPHKTPHRPRGSISLANLASVHQETDAVAPFVVEAIKGFVRSIVLGQGQPVANVLQDTLRLLTLWFTYGSKQGVVGILTTELEKISPENWLGVVPQLIARMHVKSPEITSLLRKILVKLASTHPQALVCPISVALNTTNTQQKKMASELLTEMRKFQSQLVDEATMVSRELMRVAMTPHEIWHDGLELAAQQYMEFKDIPAMLETLNGLHEAMNDSGVASGGDTGSGSSTAAAAAAASVDTPSASGADTTAAVTVEGFSESAGKVSHSTLRDISFRHSYGRPLAEAQGWLMQFTRSAKLLHLHQAWEVYQIVFKRIKAQLKTFKNVELHHVSPALTKAANLRLAVPGTYRPFVDTVSIRSFSASVEVIASKQRPRRMSMIGSDGVNYQFLLKGHEDLRQDERVMQLFGLINVCLDNDRTTQNRGLSIVRYSVLPLSNNSGVIGWVENCDTLNQLVKQYRELKNVRLNIENKLISNKCPHYVKLPVIHKVEVFNQVLDETTGQDLAKMLWLTSKTADTWVERRLNFTKSMAVMSMVGYILGLGDRHPSNLMVDRISGRVVHIDFGDCFEVTSKRAKFPEIIPFRLTRMLITAMEKSGIEGTYRVTSERVMRVMRDNRDSVMAMLEAFVYDPLISWRLLGVAADQEGPTQPVPGDPVVKSPMQMMLESRDEGAGVDRLKSDSSDTLAELVGGGGGDAVVNGNSDGFNPDADWAGGMAADVLAELAAPAAITAVAASMLTRRQSASMDPPVMETQNEESLNARALEVITRIQAKLTGKDFAKSDFEDELTVEQQVDELIKEATSVENLCQLYQGWCPLW